MANWRYTVNVARPIRDFGEGDGTPQTACAGIYEALAAVLPEGLMEATPVWDIEYLGESPSTTAGDLEQAMDDLLRWADGERVWIEHMVEA